jgi:hypothetical protein
LPTNRGHRKSNLQHFPHCLHSPCLSCNWLVTRFGKRYISICLLTFCFNFLISGNLFINKLTITPKVIFSKTVRLLKYRYYILSLILPEFSPPYPIAKRQEPLTPAFLGALYLIFLLYNRMGVVNTRMAGFQQRT